MRELILGAAMAALAASVAAAQPSPEMRARIEAIGRVVDPPSNVALYGPLQKPAAADVKVVRDVAYGPNPREILDVFPAGPSERRPVLVFLPGGPGDKRSPFPGGEGLYDNVMLWARAHGMVGVNAERRAGPEPDAAPKDVALTLQWVRKSIAAHGGDPDRIFVWGHSAGATALAQYLARPELQGPGGPGVKGAVLGAGTYDLYPFIPASPPAATRIGMTGPLTPSPTPVEPERSIAAGLKAMKTPVLITAAEFDPPVLIELAQELDRELKAAGRKPGFVLYKGHGHLSAVFAVNSDDHSTSDPIAAWMKSVR